LRLRVSATAETILRGGHPWLFAESVREQNRAGEMGELAVIYDRNDKFLAVGLYDPKSPIRVRVLHTGKPQTLDDAWWRKHLTEALAKRNGCFDALTTGYRCINGESDGWPGLVLDRYGGTLALKIYTAAWLPRLAETVNLISEQTAAERIVLRLSRNIHADAAKFENHDGQVLKGAELSGAVVFWETGLRFEADVLRGQKTGFFLDQRENRRIVETLAADRTMLNAFSFSGGFALYAARGGAKSVTNLDLSKHALAGAKRNFALNEDIAAVKECPHETAPADVFEWLESTKRKFDLIVLDPPSLAKREAERAGAIQAYTRLAELGMRALNAGGILVAASCSAHVSAPEFFSAVRAAAEKSGRKFSELRTTGHAVDHAAKFKEGEYLKTIYLKME
jgi:23S rRNA (cytosine1962-C5)-methyltransferase